MRIIREKLVMAQHQGADHWRLVTGLWMNDAGEVMSLVTRHMTTGHSLGLPFVTLIHSSSPHRLAKLIMNRGKNVS